MPKRAKDPGKWKSWVAGCRSVGAVRGPVATVVASALAHAERGNPTFVSYQTDNGFAPATYRLRLDGEGVRVEPFDPPHWVTPDVQAQHVATIERFIALREETA